LGEQCSKPSQANVGQLLDPERNDDRERSYNQRRYRTDHATCAQPHTDAREIRTWLTRAQAEKY